MQYLALHYHPLVLQRTYSTSSHGIDPQRRIPLPRPLLRVSYSTSKVDLLRSDDAVDLPERDAIGKTAQTRVAEADVREVERVRDDFVTLRYSRVSGQLKVFDQAAALVVRPFPEGRLVKSDST